MGQTLETHELPPWSPPTQDDACLAIVGTHMQTGQNPTGAHGGDRNGCRSPVSELCYFSQVGGWPRSTLPARNGSPGACQPMPNTPFVFVPCSARRWDSGLITDGWGQFVTSTHGSSAHTRDLRSHSSPCPQAVSTDASPYGNAFATSKRLKMPLHRGQANVGWGEREDNGVGGARTRHRLTVSGQAPPESLPGGDGA